MAPTVSSAFAAGLVLSACPLAAEAFVPVGSGAILPENAAALRGTGAVSQNMPVQESANTSAPHILGVMALAGAATAVSRRRGRNTRIARKAEEKAPAAKEKAPAAKEKEAEEAPPAPKWNKETEIGAQAPLGFFDPAGFCENEEKFKDFRAKELKHGRLAMMGAVGLLVQSVVQVPGMEGVPKNIFAITQGNGLIGGVAILAIIGGLEAVVFVQDPNKEPGNFGNPLPLIGNDYSDEMRAKELNNGRMAMGSFLLVALTSLATGKSAIQQFGL